ncbi:MAG TPA: CoA transferase, partial [Tepidiformaceae bacterium]|nr:CoA transferase [Tepidiformaceae bacterium]
PDIIYCENTAFGKEGPDSHLRGYDIVAQAMSGVITSNPHIRDNLPAIVAFAPADIVTGVAMAWAISAALFHKERTGEGQAINSSLLHTSLFLQAGARQIVALDEEKRLERLAALTAARERGASMAEIYEERRRAAPELAGNIYYRPYQTKDGYLVVGALGPGPRARFRDALQVHDPRYDEGFEPTPTKLHELGAVLTAECEAKFQERTNAEWLAYLSARDIACGPVRFVDELFDNPQVVENAYLAEYEHPLFGTIRSPAPIVRMSATPTRINRSSPTLGEHTDEILREAGLDESAIASLHESDIVR